MMKKILSMSILYSAVFLFACTSTNDKKEDAEENSGINSLEELAPQRAGLFVYRGQSPEDGSAVNVYINGEYFTSLPKNYYHYIELCPGEQRVEAVYHNRDPAYANKHAAGRDFNLKNKVVNYLRVGADENELPKVVAVNAEDATELFSNLTYQNMTLSRVSQQTSCL